MKDVGESQALADLGYDGRESAVGSVDDLPVRTRGVFVWGIYVL
jgi:hypothetical protein